jgi:hypothetical protein
MSEKVAIRTAHAATTYGQAYVVRAEPCPARTSGIH